MNQQTESEKELEAERDIPVRLLERKAGRRILDCYTACESDDELHGDGYAWESGWRVQDRRG